MCNFTNELSKFKSQYYISVIEILCSHRLSRGSTSRATKNVKNRGKIASAFGTGIENITIKAARISAGGSRGAWGNRIIMRDVNLLGISGA